MRIIPSPRWRAARLVSPWLPLLGLAVLLAVTLSGCFQTASEPVAPTLADLTSIATIQAATPTPFITPLSTAGFFPPTEDPNSFLTVAPTQEGPAATVEAPAGPTEPPISATTTALLATPTALATEGPCVHTVQPGEWFYSIARKYNISPADLMAANPKRNPDSLQPGDVLNLPNCNKAPTPSGPTPTSTPPSLLPTATLNPNAPTLVPLSGRTYSVAAGDTLGGIARKFNTTVQAIKDDNGLTNDFLNIGQVLKIPQPVQ